MTALHSSQPPLLNSIRQSQERHQLFPVQATGKTLPVVVAVSGGADSVCLLHLLHSLKDAWQLDLHVAHFDHATRPSSAQDASFVADLAERLGLPFHVERSLPSQGVPNEATLRTLRYRFLCKIARQITPAGQIPLVAVAHHADDQAETILFRLVRGAGLHGLRGMQPSVQRFDPDLQEYVQIVRPLLDARRSEIVRYLHDHNLRWCDDPSNLSLDYARNRIRNTILPELQTLNPQAVDAIVRTAKVLEDGAERLSRLDQALLDALQVGTNDSGRIVLDLKRLQALEATEQRAVLRLAVGTLLGHQREWHELSFEQVEQLRRLLQTQQSASQAHPLLEDVVWSVLAEKSEPTLLLSLHRASVPPYPLDHPHLPNPFSPLPLAAGTTLTIGDWQLQSSEFPRHHLPTNWRSNPNPWQAWLDADKISAPMLSGWNEGMQVAPLGMNGKRKSLGDFFTDRKIHPSERESWPLLVDATTKEVLWVCGLAMGHSVRITEETSRVLAVGWQTKTKRET